MNIGILLTLSTKPRFHGVPLEVGLPPCQFAFVADPAVIAIGLPEGAGSLDFLIEKTRRPTLEPCPDVPKGINRFHVERLSDEVQVVGHDDEIG